MGAEFELDPADAVAVGAIGEPGHREFYIQARDSLRALTMLVEKVQVQALSDRAVELLEGQEIEPREEPAALVEPVVPDWRAGEVGLGFDGEQGRLVLVAREAPADPDTPEAELATARIWARPAQMLAFAD